LKIIKEKEIAEKILKQYWKNSEFIIRENFEFKKILNDFYSPDEYLFFEYKNEICPLVIKDNLVTFYGGIHYNEYNVLPKNKEFLNRMVEKLNKMNISFRLLSIIEDYKDNLNKEFFEKFDVPFSAYWIYDDIQEYSLDKILINKKSKTKNNLTRCLKKINDYEVKNIDKENVLKILEKGKNYFKNRGINFGWEGKEILFKKLLTHLKLKFNVFGEIILKNKKKVGVYIMVYNKKSLLYFFGMPLENDNCISAILYDRFLNNSRKIAKIKNLKYLDAMKGGFSYKQLFNFKPIPLYALVKDNSWQIKLNSDFSVEEYNKIFNRNYKKGLFNE
jgi:hypothetical protein